MTEWKRVVSAGDCKPCECCGEPYCATCDDHYADCECPGPTQHEEYDYRTRRGVLEARPIA